MIVTIYSVPRDSPWSHELKSLLHDNNVEYEEYFPYPDLAAQMVERYDYPSFPLVWCDEVFIGGWTECRRWLLGDYR
jgi:glutaredoxin